MASSRNTSGLEHFHTVVQNWFGDVFGEATDAQKGAWPAITSNQHTLLLAPTGSGKTLAAFLVAINRLMFPQPVVTPRPGVKTLYISPLKALGVDIERNLRVPLQGIRQVAERMGVDHHNPLIAVRTGDTPPGDRQRMLRRPPDILITTPESLYLLLTSSGRNILRHVECVIVDEIHAMAATKRGAHLFTTLERLEDWVQQNHGNPVQRIGLSATQQPLEEVARLLGGFSANANPRSAPQPRAVAIIEAGRRRALQLTVEVPVEDMARLSEQSAESFATPGAIAVPSIWPAIYPRLVELIRSHRTTLVFVNSRRLAERVAQSINESAKADIARAHHGSLAKDVRLGIENSLKLGELPAIVATSSLELGIDMGSIDLVIQIESPPTVAAGIQRIGRSGHHVGGVSEGRIFPKFRADLLACSAAAARMMSGEVESTYYPRNPLDVLAQQVVAIVAGGPQHSDAIYRIVRGAAPFRDLTLHVYYGVLDLMSGRYPSTNFAELRPRINWDRVTNILSPRKSSQRTAILNAGTIPDRGLYGVFLDNGGEKSMRVGELDEEMVFETRAGEVFTLGASSWRVTDITRDRVLVVPAPGEPAKMPFWRGDSPGRPFEFGKAIGKLTRELLSVHVTEAQHRLVTKHGLDARAADNLLAYLSDQREATQYVPSDRTIVIESFLDEVGDYRIAILSPFGARVNAPWTTAITARLRADLQIDVDSTWSDDGILLRVPKTVGAPDMSVLVPASHEVETIVTRELGSTALFAARFRENAARALLLPRQQPGKRVPLWLQRRKAADLLAVAAKYPQFPILLETYRECLRDVFDLPSLQELLSQIECGAIHIHQLHNDSPSPFAASLLFSYSGNFIYSGDTPLAERKAQSLTLDYAQLREILGAGEIRELIDPGVLDTTALELQRQSGNLSIRSADDLHDLLRNLGDLTQDEILQRRGASSADLIDTWLQELLESRRVILVSIHQDARLIAVEDAGRYRDALGLTLPTGIPEAFIERCSNALEELVSRYARTHVPFRAVDVADRLGLAPASVERVLKQLEKSQTVLEGEFLPNGFGREWCDRQVMRQLKRRSLRKLRQQIAPVKQSALGQFLPAWQHVLQPRRGLDGVLDVIEQLQGLWLPVSVWEHDVMPSRVVDFLPHWLDELSAAGEVIWQANGFPGASDARVAFFLTDSFPALAHRPERSHVDPLCAEITARLKDRGALLFEELVTASGRFGPEVKLALMDLVGAGEVSNDTLSPMRSQSRHVPHPARVHSAGTAFRSRRQETARSSIPGMEGRWRCLPIESFHSVSHTKRQVALSLQLAQRYGVVTREWVLQEQVLGGFSGLYGVYKNLEESGRLRRGYFIEGLGAAQFAVSGAEDRLRSTAKPQQDNDQDSDSSRCQWLVLSALDPANPYGAALPWPKRSASDGRPQRVAGAHVVLDRGELAAYLSKTHHQLLIFRPDTTPNGWMEELATTLMQWTKPRAPLLISKIDGQISIESEHAAAFRQCGFISTSKGLLCRRSTAVTLRPSTDRVAR